MTPPAFNSLQYKRYAVSKNAITFDHLTNREKSLKLQELRKVVSDLRYGKTFREETLRNVRALERELGIPGLRYNRRGEAA